MGNKFQVGDRVRALIDTRCGAFYTGDKGTVTEMFKRDNEDWLAINWDRTKDVRFARADEVKLITPIPVVDNIIHINPATVKEDNS